MNEKISVRRGKQTLELTQERAGATCLSVLEYIVPHDLATQTPALRLRVRAEDDGGVDLRRGGDRLAMEAALAGLDLSGLPGDALEIMTVILDRLAEAPAARRLAEALKKVRVS